MKYFISVLSILLSLYFYRRARRDNGCVVRLIYFELIYNLFIKYLIGNLGLPSMLNYVTDAVLVWIVLEYLLQKKKIGLRIPKSIVLCAILLWLVSLLSYIGNMYSPLLYLWGFRNNFRFIIFAMMCSVYLRKRDIDTIMDILFGFFLLNIVVVTYQHYFVTYSESAFGDFISGLYSNGAERGGNASLDWHMCIICTYAITRYLNKSGTFWHLIICIFGSFYMAALAEIKLLYIQIAIVSFLAIAICKKSIKMFIFTVAGFVGLYLGVQFLYYSFPKFDGFFTYQTIIGYVTKSGGYSSKGYSTGIDRMTVFPYIFTHFLDSWQERILGIGLGNAEFSSFYALTSDFYKKYSWSGYTFFSSSFITIEMGVLGFGTYLVYYANYIRCAVSAITNNISKNKNEQSVLHTTIIIGLMCFLMIFLNQSLKMETSAYMVNCVLTFPFLLLKTEDTTEVGESLIGRLLIRWRKRV